MSNLLKDASILLTPTGYDNGSMNAIKPENGDGDFTFSRNSAATRVNAQGLVENVQIISPELVSNGDFSQIGTEEVLNGNFSQEGSELITNGDFATDSNWTLASGISYNSNGYIDFDGTQGNDQARNTPNITFVAGKTYKVVYEIKNYVSGSIRFRFQVGTNTIGQLQSGDGIKTEYIVCNDSANNNFQFFNSPSFIGSIDNVSVKEVGQNWELDTGWSIGDDKVEADGTSAFLIQSNFQSVASVKSYKIQYEVLSTNGVNIRFGGGSSMFGTPTLDTTTIGVKTIYLQSNGTVKNLQFQNNLGFIGSITNISVKEVGQDWDLGTGWSIGEDKVVATDVDSTFLDQLNILTAGKLYKITYTILDYVSGSVRFRANLVNGSSNSANGTYTDYIVSAGTKFSLQGLNNFNGSITNISVKEITDDTDLPRINYSGFSYQDSLGSELVTNGDFSNGSANWINVSNLAVFENSSVVFENDARIYQNVVSDLTKTYNIEINFSAISGNGIMILVGNGNSFINYSVSDIINNGNKINISKESFIGSGILFIYSQNSSTSAVINNVSVKEYLGQEVVPDSGCGSWLLEPQSTNLITYSSDYTQTSWNKLGSPTITANYGSSPDGENNSTRIQGNSSTVIYASGSYATSNFNRSIYIKATSGIGDIQLLSHNSNTNNVFTINENWQRLDINSLTSGVGNNVFYAVDMRGASTSIYDIEIWGAQSEDNISYATSYIPTNGATNTRLQDIATNSGNASLINSTEGVLYAEIAALANDGTDRFISISDNTNNNILRLQYITTDNSINSQYKVGGVTQASLTASLNSLDFNKIAVKYKENDFSLWTNGIKVATDNSGAVNSPGTFTEVEFTRGGNALPFYGKTKALAVYKEALTDANLRCLTYPNPVATTFDLDFDTIAEQFTFTRGSEATFVNEQGLIQSTNQIGPELVTNGDFATDSDWILTSGTNISNGQLNVSESSYVFFARQTNVVTIGKQYKVTFDVDIQGGNGVLVYLSDTSAFAIIQASGTHTFYFTADGTQIRFRSYDQGFIGSIDNVSVKEVISATNTPRIDYSTGAKAFLLEPQSTNLITYSSDLSSLNSRSNAVVTSNEVTSPSGDLDADKITFDGTLYGRVEQTIPATVGQPYTISVYLKNKDLSDVTQVWIGFSAASQGQFVTITDEWQRYEVTINADGTSEYPRIQFSGTGSLYAWGFQTEQQSYTTSYIPTSGASATRNQELCKDATPVINSEEGTLYAEISALADNTTNQRISLSYDNQNFVRIAINNLQINFSVFNNGAYQANMNYTVSNITDFNKIAVKYKENDFALWINGTEVLTDTSGLTSFSSPLDHINFSNANGGGSFFYGNTKGLKYYPKALADVQLEDLTTI